MKQKLPHKEGDWFIDSQTNRAFVFGHEIETDAVMWMEIDINDSSIRLYQQVDPPSLDMLNLAYIDSPDGWIPEKRNPAYGIRGIENLTGSPKTV